MPKIWNHLRSRAVRTSVSLPFAPAFAAILLATSIASAQDDKQDPLDSAPPTEQVPRPVQTPVQAPTPVRTPVAPAQAATPAQPAARPVARPVAPGQPGQPGQPAPGGQPGRTPHPRSGPAAAPGSAAVEGTAGGPTGEVPPPPDNPIVEGAEIPEVPVEEELPEAEDEGGVVTVIVRQQPIEKVFDTINEKLGVRVRSKGAVEGQKVDLTAKDKTVTEILNELISGQEWTWIKREDGTYEVWDKASFVDQVLKSQVVRRTFRLEHVPATDVLPAIEGVKSEVGLVAANPRTNELIVTDVPDKLALIQSLIEEIDVALWTRTFRIRWADFASIQERLEAVKSPAGELQLDPFNRVIVATDTFEKIKRMEQLIEMIDVDRPIMLYNLNSIGLEAADAEDMIDRFIVPLTTPDTLVEFNATQGVVLIQDIPEVHERILEVLRVLDRSPKQIWIEGEIMEVTREYDLEFGTELSFSGDMTSAIRDGLIAPFVTGTGTDDDPAPIQTGSPGLPVVSTGAGGLRVRTLSGDVKAELNAMMSDMNNRLLLQPRALVRNGEEVIVDLTEENPQVTTFFNNFNSGTNNNNNFASSSITFVPTGLSITLVPTISNRGLIEMEIDFENSTPIFVENIDTPQGPQDAVGRNSQRIQTVLVIPSGETRVLGGLVRRQTQESNSGVPFLSKIPWIGPLFGTRSTSNDTRNLLFFLTPTIVQEEPQIDVVQIPVNPPARDAVQDSGARPFERPSRINPIPEEMKPLLRSVSPSRRDLAEDEPPAAPVVEEPPPPDAEDEALAIPEEGGLDFPAVGEDALEDASGILMETPPDRPSDQPATLGGIEGPGANVLAGSGAAGPSGTLAIGGASGGSASASAGVVGGAKPAPLTAGPGQISPVPGKLGTPTQVPQQAPIPDQAAPDQPAPDLPAPGTQTETAFR